MTMSDQVEAGVSMEAILGETISALSRLQADELEELESRLALIATELGPGITSSTTALERKLSLLEACLRATAENLTVLGRLHGRAQGRAHGRAHGRGARA